MMTDAVGCPCAQLHTGNSCGLIYRDRTIVCQLKPFASKQALGAVLWDLGGLKEGVEESLQLWG